MARPSEYTQEKADSICHLLAEGMSLRSVCKEKGMPDIATVFKWMRSNEEFLKQYARAKQESADAMAEEVLDIADNAVNDWMEVNHGEHKSWKENGEAINRSRLRVDTRKWLMAKMKPKKYGEKLDVVSDGEAIKGNTIIVKNFKDGASSE
jgi:hypothetical protein